MAQTQLFGREHVAIDHQFIGARRVQLSEFSWVEHCNGWMKGHSEMFDRLRDGLSWKAQQREMYERIVDVPRLLASWSGPQVKTCAGDHGIIDSCVDVLSSRYGRDLSAVSLAYYRDGRDSVAPHGDRMGRLADDCVIAIVAVGDRRTFQLRPVGGTGPHLRFSLGWGDLLVMGGRAQREFLHGIPKTKRPVGPRISIQFRERAS